MKEGVVTVKAPAKVNLTLEVLGRRSDGYHEVATVLQTVDLYDTLALELADTLTLESHGLALPQEENLAWRAARLLQQECGVGQGARIRLHKEIPVAAGLGGGSSDAAAVLRGLNQLWGLGLMHEHLVGLGARLGSDIPFFIYGGTALAQGRGERVQPLPDARLPWIVLLCPPVPAPSEKTASLYAALTQAHFTSGALARDLAERIRGQGDVPAESLFNAFDTVAPKLFPGLGACWRAFQEMGAPKPHLCGSGPALFALLSLREPAVALRDLLIHDRGWPAYVVRPVQLEPIA